MNKKVLVAILACVLGIGSAVAAVIVSDTFSYSDGALVPNGGWANHSGTPGTLLVSSGAVEILMDGSAPEDANLAFTPVAGNIYFGIDFTVRADSVITGGDYEYFAHFKDTGFNFSARLDAVEAVGGGDYSVGIGSDDSTADAVWPTDLVFGTTYRAVVRYDQDANIAELWVNPLLETDPSILGDDKLDPGDVVSAFALRQSFSSANETILVDNLCVGGSFSDVVSCDTVGVESSTWSSVKSLYGDK